MNPSWDEVGDQVLAADRDSHSENDNDNVPEKKIRFLFHYKNVNAQIL